MCHNKIYLTLGVGIGTEKFCPKNYFALSILAVQSFPEKEEHMMIIILRMQDYFCLLTSIYGKNF